MAHLHVSQNSIFKIEFCPNIYRLFGRGHHQIFCLFKNYVFQCQQSHIVANHVSEVFQVNLRGDLEMHIASGWGIRVLWKLYIVYRIPTVYGRYTVGIRWARTYR